MLMTVLLLHFSGTFVVLNEKQAKVVRRIFQDFEKEMFVPDIANGLNAECVCGLRDRPAWADVTISVCFRMSF